MPDYSIIIPVRDEEAFIARMLDSVLSQRVKPLSIHVVDDGSSDRTPEILTAYRRLSPLVRVTTRPQGGPRREGGESAIGVGFASVDWARTEILARMDADLSFDHGFFETLLAKFRADPRLGIASGLIHEPECGGWAPRPGPSYHTRGACKLYRRECYRQIEPIGTRLGWDGQDEARANYHGWNTRSYEDAVLFHHRPVGAASGRMRYFRNLGLSAYYIGYHPVFLMARAVGAMCRRPLLLGGVMMISGLLEGYLKKLPREDRDDVIAFVRRQQLNRLTGRRTMWK